MHWDVVVLCDMFSGRVVARFQGIHQISFAAILTQLKLKAKKELWFHIFSGQIPFSAPNIEEIC